MVTATAVLALAYPSLVSVGFALLTNSLLLPSFFNPRSRVTWGLALHFFNMIILTTYMGWKINLLVKKGSRTLQAKSTEDLTDATELLASQGFAVTLDN